MKKLITILFAGLLTLASYGQSGVAHFTGIQLGTAPVAYNLVSTNSYVIDKVGSTYYARPGIGTGLTAYSNAVFATALNAAIAQLQGGGVIYIRPGTYTVVAPITITTLSNIKLQGAGNDLTVFTSAGNGTVYSILKIIGTCSNIEISGIKFISTVNDATVIDQNSLLEADDVGPVALIINGLDIHNCTFTGATVNTSAIYLGAEFATTSRLNRIKIHDNYIYNIGQCGIGVINHASQTTSIINSLEISRNDINTPGLSGTWGMGITVSGFNTNTTIQYNNISESKKDQSIELRCCVNGDISFNKISNYAGHTSDATLTAGISIADDAAHVQKSIHIAIIGNIINIVDADFATSTATATVGLSTIGCEDVNISSNSIKSGMNTFSGTKITFTGNTVVTTNYYCLVLNTGCTYFKAMSNIFDASTTVNGDWAAIPVLFQGDANNNEITSSVAIGNIDHYYSYGGTATNNILELDALPATGTSASANPYRLLPGNNLHSVGSSNANYYLTLPPACDALTGKTIKGSVGANGFELRVAAAQATTVYINGITTNVEAAIPANSSFEVTCIDATHWILKAWTALGAEITAIIPDAV